jgi:endonuclease/exonuclease/phosphatase family metal-dependent hydrolase
MEEKRQHRPAWRRNLRWGVPVVIGLLLILWGLNGSRAGTRIEGCPEGCSTAAPRREGPLRVMSVNVLHDFPRFRYLAQRLDLVAAEIRRQDADIVCLQEVPWTLRLGSGIEYLARQTGMNYLYVRADGNRHTILFEAGDAILSRFSLGDLAFVELEPQVSYFEHRMALHATAATPWGNVRIYATHLTSGHPADNPGQAASLQAFVESTGSVPAIVAGDFNAREDTSQIQALSEGWVDTYRVANPGDAGWTCCINDLTAETDTRDERIDYLFLVPGSGAGASVVSSVRVLDRPVQTADGWLWASDHVGVLSAIQLEP